MRKVKVGVVGVGYLGYIHAKLYQQIKNAELVAVCDINEKRLREVESQLKVRGYLDHQELFDKAEAVSIATPTSSHYT
ncbi:MAG: Gfo/Idh/MocA family oxidoreductase, partial [Candidatus Omnitrophica bacterium]|nr:Gfo/Idh/MocA family oxidoreductase [Candidatus Omnitrophota bacterium]